MVIGRYYNYISLIITAWIQVEIKLVVLHRFVEKNIFTYARDV